MSDPHFESVTCPECKTGFEVDPTASATYFTCPYCGEKSALIALRNPSPYAEAVQISGHMSRAAAALLHGRTAVFVKEENGHIASGTIVGIRGHVFVATAGHTVPEDAVRLTFVGKGSYLHLREHPTLDIRRFSRFSESEGMDVGLIELDANAPSRLDLQAISLDNIVDSKNGSPNRKGWVIGYPFDYSVFDQPYKGVRQYRSLCYGIEAIEPRRWAMVSRKRSNLDADKHVISWYEREDIVDLDSAPDVDHAPEPFGMSGGGFWQSAKSTQDDDLWHLESISLFAIQSS